MGCEIFILQQLIHLEQNSSITVGEEGDDNVETHLHLLGPLFSVCFILR